MAGVEPRFVPKPRRLRLAWVEEWMSTLAAEMLPYLARHHDVYYVTAGEEIPDAPFAQVLRARRWPVMNLAGFGLSRLVNRLHAEGKIDLALVWASIGFGLGRVPFINLEGTSVWAEIELFAGMFAFSAGSRNVRLVAAGNSNGTTAAPSFSSTVIFAVTVTGAGAAP